MPKATAEQVVIEIVRQAEGELSAKTRLFKAFYFAHLAYFDDNPGILTDWPIARMPNGPGIDNSDGLIDSLVAKGLLVVERYHDGFYPEYRYRLTEKGKESPNLGKAETESVAKAVAFVRNKSCSELSNLTHEKSRSWQMGKNGDRLNIYIDIIPDDEYERMRRAIPEQSELDAVFSQ